MTEYEKEMIEIAKRSGRKLTIIMVCAAFMCLVVVFVAFPVAKMS